MIQKNADHWTPNANLKSAVATRQLEEVLRSIEKRQRKEEIGSIIRGLGRKISELSDTERETVAYSVIKRLKGMKAGIAKCTRVSVLLHMILDGSWAIAIAEFDEATVEAVTNLDSDDGIAIREPQGASSSMPGIAAVILHQMKISMALVQNQQNDIHRLKHRKSEER